MVERVLQTPIILWRLIRRLRKQLRVGHGEEGREDKKNGEK